MSRAVAVDDMRQGVTANAHATLDALCLNGARWAVHGEEWVEAQIEVYTAAPNAKAADLVIGAAMMLFLADRRAA